MAWLAAGALAVWAVVRLFGLEAGFPLVPLIAYTPLAGLAAALMVAIAGLLRLWAVAAVAAAAAVLLAALVLPRALPADQSGLPDDGPELRVMTANLYLGEADTGHTGMLRLADLRRHLESIGAAQPGQRQPSTDPL